MMKASLTKGILEIQLNLVDFYTSNLSSFGDQGALLAGFAYTAIFEALYPSSTRMEYWISYPYYFFSTICLICSLFIVTQSTIVTMFGPSMALSGESSEAVISSVLNMRKQQTLIFKIGILAIASLYLSGICFTWARGPIGVSVLCTILYLGGFYVMVREGRKTYLMFVPPDEAKDGHKPALLPSFLVPQNTANLKSETNSTVVSESKSRKTAEELVNTRATGEIWMRQSLSRGGKLEICFGVLENGKFDIYRNEDDYNSNHNPITKKPFQLWKYRIESDVKKFSTDNVSLVNSLRSAVTGQGEFSVATLATSEYDLVEAVKKYRFLLVPKILSELSPLPIGDFMASDETAYKLWTKSLGRVIDAYEELEENKDSQATMSGNANIESMVQAANQVY